MIKQAPWAAALLFSLAGVAQAEGFALGAHAGLMGPGVAAYYKLNDYLVLRGGYNKLDITYNTTEDDLDFEGKVKLDNGHLGLDVYPFAGGFRLSAAYVMNRNGVDLRGVPNSEGFFQVNGNTYFSDEVDDIRANIKYPDAALYAGLGWGNPVRTGKGFGLTFDVGVVLTGEADLDTRVNCGTTTAQRCQQLNEDVNVETEKLKEDLGEYKLWPLVQLGLSYQF